MAELPELTSLHPSSFKTISEDQIPSKLPFILAYKGPITISAPPKTDYWRHPPNTDNHNAPTRMIPFPIDINRFHSATVTFSADWNTPYDQGGLILFIPGEDPTPWLKTGIEFYGEKPFGMSVATNQWSDAAQVPLEKGKDSKMTIRVERQVNGGERMDSLRVCIVDETGNKEGIRQVTWWFARGGFEQISSKGYLLIGVYAARPSVPEGEGREHEELVVKFEDFKVELFDPLKVQT